MNKKIFAAGFAIVLLLVMSGFVSARISYSQYNARDDVKIYSYEPRQEVVDIRYITPKERTYFYQIGTYAETYGKFDVVMVKKDYGNFSSYPNQIVSQRYADYSGYRGKPYMRMYLFDW